MSLDVYLKRKKFVRYDEKNSPEYVEYEYVYDANYTHNLSLMAAEVSEDFYKAIWRPEELGCVYANDIILFLNNGLEELKSKPEYYKKFNPENGWGNYYSFVEWVEKYLDACITYPNAEIEVSR